MGRTHLLVASSAATGACASASTRADNSAPPSRADVNGDDGVNFEDLTIVLSSFGVTHCTLRAHRRARAATGVADSTRRAGFLIRMRSGVPNVAGRGEPHAPARSREERERPSTPGGI